MKMTEALELINGLENLTVLSCVGLACWYFYNQYNKLKKKHEEYEVSTKNLIIDFNERLLKNQMEFSLKIEVLQRDTLNTMNSIGKSLEINTKATNDLFHINEKLIDRLYNDE